MRITGCAVAIGLACMTIIPVATAQTSAVDAICGKYFPTGAVYRGSEYRNGRATVVTITYTGCIEMAATHATMKVQLHFDRQEAGAAPKKAQWLEFYVVDASNLKWRNMSGTYPQKSRALALNADGSYIEKLAYMNGDKDEVRYTRKN